ncbi:thioredoxin [Candidatus Sumerlaeota bacterium]|nr:thioredoxin [Candidatus Sumerlaeota bacterium]
MAAGTALHATNNDFDTVVLQSDQPVFVDFWAAWCGPCRAIAPLVEELAKEFDGKAKVVKVDIDEAGDIAGRYGVTSIPTLMVFKGGQPVEQQVGRIPKDLMVRMLSKHV